MSTPRYDSLKVRLGAAILAMATVTAVVFGVINFQQRVIFSVPDDGVSWLETPHGVEAWNTAPKSPAANAGIRAGDRVVSIDGQEIHNTVDVTKHLWRLGVWSQARYRIERGGR